jgi:deazaflavin-dependent oxidoreductase (nitroreductase family)
VGRYSHVRGRRLTRYESTVERFAASPAGGWLFVHVLSRADRRVLPLTRGRVSLALGTPVGMLETVGARSGRLRRTPLVYLADGERIVLVASNGGGSRHPGWLFNLRARPAVRFLSRERGWRAYHAHEASGDERERCWALATDFYVGYDAYARRTARAIGVVVLEPRAGGGPTATTRA